MVFLYIHLAWAYALLILGKGMRRPEGGMAITESHAFFIPAESATLAANHAILMHIGSLIRQKVDEKGITVVRFAEQLACTRANVYKIFSKKSIDTDTLMRVSVILDFDFFAVCSSYFCKSVSE